MDDIEKILGGDRKPTEELVDVNDLFSANMEPPKPEIRPREPSPVNSINSSIATLMKSLAPVKQPLFIELSQKLQKQLISHEEFTQKARALLDPNYNPFQNVDTGINSFMSGVPKVPPSVNSILGFEGIESGKRMGEEAYVLYLFLTLGQRESRLNPIPPFLYQRQEHRSDLFN